MLRIFLISVLFIFLGGKLKSQTIKVSPELNMRNDFSYFILPFKNLCSIIRDKSYRITIQNLSPEFNWTSEKDISLVGKKWKLLDCFPHEENLGILYIAKIDEKNLLVYSVYKHSGELIYSYIPTLDFEPSFASGVNLVSSINKHWVSLGLRDKEDYKRIILINRFDTLAGYGKKFEDIFQMDEFVTSLVVLNNSGNFYLLGTEKVNNKKRALSKLKIQGIDARANQILNRDFVLNDVEPFDFKMKFNPLTDAPYIAGLYNNIEDQFPSGYMSIDLSKSSDPSLIAFDKEQLKKWGVKDKNSFQNQFTLSVKDILFKVDSSVVIFFENSKELMRRPYFTNAMDPGLGAVRWVDYYYDDILVLNLNYNGEILWESILRKKQFSQDDEGLYSSFFIFSNPSFLRIIFNDEIKSESTVSEYILLPDGRNYRKSILNSGIMNFNLRIQDAIQSGSNELWIPSESSGKMVLVKITLS